MKTSTKNLIFLLPCFVVCAFSQHIYSMQRKVLVAPASRCMSGVAAFALRHCSSKSNGELNNDVASKSVPTKITEDKVHELLQEMKEIKENLAENMDKCSGILFFAAGAYVFSLLNFFESGK